MFGALLTYDIISRSPGLRNLKYKMHHSWLMVVERLILVVVFLTKKFCEAVAELLLWDFKRYFPLFCFPLSQNICFIARIQYFGSRHVTKKFWGRLCDPCNCCIIAHVVILNYNQQYYEYVSLYDMYRPLLLECSTREVREVFGKLLEKTMASFFQMGGIAVCICSVFLCIFLLIYIQIPMSWIMMIGIEVVECRAMFFALKIALLSVKQHWA